MKKRTVLLSSMLLGVTALSLPLVSALEESKESKRTTSEAVEQAHAALWSKFIDKNGHVIDFVGEIPTPEDCALGKPNLLGWRTPLANGTMSTGNYLATACERARRSGDPVDKSNARLMAQGLLKSASVSDVPGMIVRGFSTDGKSHFPFGSDDQTHPWFYGLYLYWKSDIPSAAEKKAIVDKIKEVAGVLESTSWKCPCDGSFKGTFRGKFGGEGFRDVARYLFMLKVTHEITGDNVWLERYKKALSERPGKRGMTRLEICAAGYGPDIALNKWSQNVYPNWNWIYVGAQASIKHLVEMETDPAIKAQYQAGLTAGAKEALPGIAEFEKFDNNDTKVFGSANWREVYPNWFPQKSPSDAEKIAENPDKKKMGQRRNYESRYMMTPLAAAAMVALAGDPAHRDIIEKAIRHYDYQKIYMGQLFFAEYAYYALPPETKKDEGK
jgi:hypothetical protein